MNTEKLISPWQECSFRMFLLLLSLDSLGVLVYVASLPGDPKHNWLLGYSPSRWLMLAAALVLCLVPTALLVKAWVNRTWSQCQAGRVKSWVENKVILGLIFVFASALIVAALWYVNYWFQNSSDQYIQAYLVRLLPFVVWLCLAMLFALLWLPVLEPALLPVYLALLVSVLCTVVIDLFTNTPEFKQMPWDTRYYYLLAERGLDSHDLIAPYVYRYMNPLLAHWMVGFFIIPTNAALKAIALLGSVGQLFTIYLLTRFLGFRWRASLTAMLVTAFSMWNLKFLMFDIYRPDHLAYALMALAVLALFSKHIFWCLLISVLGLQTREYLAIPPLILAYFNLEQWWRNRKVNRLPGKLLLQAALAVVVTVLAVALPRWLIPATESTQFVDPSNNPSSLVNLIAMPLDLGRDFNLLFTIAAYALPLLLLVTPARIKSVWKRLDQPVQEMRPFLLIYTGLVFLLTLYGGHDLGRYFTYAFIPQVILICYLLDEDLPIEEIIYMFIVVILFNRLWLPIPIWDMDKYLDFYGGYAERVNLVSLLRLLEMLVYLGGAVALRAWIRKRYGYTRIQS